MIEHSLGADVIDGGDGTDKYDFSDAEGPINIDLSQEQVYDYGTDNADQIDFSNTDAGNHEIMMGLIWKDMCLLFSRNAS